MGQTIVAIAIVGAAIGFVWWYTQKSSTERKARRAQETIEARRQESFASGLEIGDRPLCPSDTPDCAAKQILRSDISVNNWQHVTRKFRDAYWAVRDAGGGEVAGMLAGMDAACWRFGSREQVINELVNRNLMTDGERSALFREFRARGIRDGWGASC